MYICSCNALTDRDIESAALISNGTVVDCYRQLDAQPVCGTCMDNAQELIDGARVKHAACRASVLSRPKTTTLRT